MLVDIVIWIFLITVGIVDATYDYQCWNPKSTDEYRQKFLTQINIRRKGIADGEAENQYGLLPKGKNIYMLYYWCDLELLAQEIADKCDVSARAPVGYSRVIASLCSYNQLANGKARKLGCAQNSCGEDFYAVCVLDAMRVTWTSRRRKRKLNRYYIVTISNNLLVRTDKYDGNNIDIKDNFNYYETYDNYSNNVYESFYNNTNNYNDYYEETNNDNKNYFYNYP
ncbi:unnamed protein product [Cylicostephanus goldi]|uniref:SCP domain-containing protein n=1 Tax=Cylicostephanus goldi TaxID=71465 RepID=A0A3P6RXV7_CYLGO|nr:unnamed protein product [Cylicostephanus goldi]